MMILYGSQHAALLDTNTSVFQQICVGLFPQWKQFTVYTKGWHVSKSIFQRFKPRSSNR